MSYTNNPALDSQYYNNYDESSTPEAVPLPSPPTDGITALKYLPTTGTTNVVVDPHQHRPQQQSQSRLLVSASWDGCVRIHDTTARTVKMVQTMDIGPVMSLATFDDNDQEGTNNQRRFVVGGMDGSIRMVDIGCSSSDVEQPILTNIGKHMESNVPSTSAAGVGDKKEACCVSCLGTVRVAKRDYVVSASWNQQLCVWKVPETPSSKNIDPPPPIHTAQLPGKAYSLDIDPDHGMVVVATSNRRLCFFTIRANNDSNSNDPEPIPRLEWVLERESSLKFPTRCVRFMPSSASTAADVRGIAIGSVEGRVAIEYLEELRLSAGGNKKYAFKCHRVNDRVYPVNAIEFYKAPPPSAQQQSGNHGRRIAKYPCTFATGGCDGHVMVWDGQNKKKLTTISSKSGDPFPTSIASLAFSPDGYEIAIASSYTYEEGSKDGHVPKDEIYIRPIYDHEVRPKKP